MQSQCSDLANILTVVIRTLLHTLGGVGHIELVPQVASGGVFHKTDVARCGEVEQPTLLVLGLRLGSGSIDQACGQSCQVGLVGEQHLVGVGLAQVVLAEVECNFAQLHGEGAVLLLALGRERGTAVLESFVVLLSKADLLLCESCGMAVVVDSLHPLEERFVEVDVVGVFRQLRTESL